MPSISLFRPADIAMDRNRVYKVMIDGDLVGELWPEQIGTFNVGTGTHTVRVKIDFLKSDPLAVDLEAGGIAELACRGAGSLTALLRALTRPTRYLALHPITQDECTLLEEIQDRKRSPIPRNLGAADETPPDPSA